ncbi:hypothetical protein H0H92_009767, partial [Tricholoma furcatifolium]
TNTAGKRKAEYNDLPMKLNLKKKRNTGKSAQSAFDAKWLESSKERSARVVAAAAEAKQEDDSLVSVGGFIEDSEDDEVEKKAVTAAGTYVMNLKKAPTPMVKIVSTKHVLTKTEIRGGTKKWNLHHLPKGTSEAFTQKVVPRAKAKVGTLAPWANLTIEDIQAIVDMVYGSGVHVVEAGDAWSDLISYRIHNWRNGFASEACKVVDAYLNDPDNLEALGTPEARLEAVKGWLDWQGEEGEETAPYQFKECREGSDGRRKKRGFCESAFIVHTFALAHIYYICPPDPQDLDDDMPIGAMILALQAVEHALKQYELDGTRRVDTSKKGEFSFDNYGDTSLPKRNRGGRMVDTFEPRASRYIASVKNLDRIKHWGPILEEACTIVLERKGTSRRGRKSHGASYAKPEPSKPVVKEFVIVSDFSHSDKDDIPASKSGTDSSPQAETGTVTPLDPLVTSSDYEA